MVTSLRADWSDIIGLPQLMQALDPNGEGLVRLVGGCVRDRLLGVPVSDIDLATSLVPEDVIARLKSAGLKVIPSGLAHGTVTAIVESRHFEITTLRRDEATDGRHAKVAFTDDWAEDAMRRDFTINALYSNPVTGEVFDPVGGVEDLRPTIVRFIGDADARIQEDYLRILRYFRFFARFGGDADEDALAACGRQKKGLMALSRERIASELLKILSATDPSVALAAMESIDLFSVFLSDYQAGSATRMRFLVAAEQRLAVAPNPLRRFSLILPVNTARVRAIAAQLKMAKAMADYLAGVANARAVLRVADHAQLSALFYTHGHAEMLDALLLERGEQIAETDWKSWTAWQRPNFPIKGGDLIKKGVPTGPLVSQTLHAVEAEWIAAGFPDGEELRAIVTRQLTQIAS
jgi:poly(A) polymerase